jgi:hypothetical protein
MRARLFLTTEWQGPNPIIPLPTDHTTDAFEICAECTSEDPPLASTTHGALSRPIDVGENGTVLADDETEHLQSFVGYLTALDGRDANTRTLRPMTFAGGHWTVQQDIHLLAQRYWTKLTGKGRARQEQLPRRCLPAVPSEEPRAIVIANNPPCEINRREAARHDEDELRAKEIDEVYATLSAAKNR